MPQNCRIPKRYICYFIYWLCHKCTPAEFHQFCLILNPVESINWIFSLQMSISKLIFAGTQAVKIKFEIDKKSSSKIKFKNQVQKIKLKNQYQVQMDKGSDFRLNYDQKRSCNFYRFNLTLHNCYFPTNNSLLKIN